MIATHDHLIRGDELSRSPGTLFTRQCAELVYLRPCLVVDIAAPGSVDVVREWLCRTATGLGVAELILNVAGPRESQAPGIYVEADSFLVRMLA